MADRSVPLLPPLPDASPTTEASVALPPLVSETAEPPTRSRRPPRRSRRGNGPDGRRLWSAGHAILVCLLALGVSLLLNAPGVHKKAFNQPDGWQRDVALALTGPLAGISHAVLLDRPREGVQAAIGRSGEDEIDTDIGIAVAAPTPSPRSNPARPTRTAFSPKHKLRIWVAGDSLVITPGYSILQAAGESPVMQGLGVDGRVATGLTRPDVFNWFQEIRDRVRTSKPDVVVLSFGGNDDKAYMTGLPEGVSIGSFGDAAWRREYQRRLAAVFATVARAGGHTIWIGLPQTSSAGQTRRFDVVNAAAAAVAKNHPGQATYLDTYAMFAGPDGGYVEYLKGPSGGDVKVRADDGVHFERAGGDLIAREVMKILAKRYDLTSWKRAHSGTG
jgi:hypothetical protein